ncbi:MAG: GtrA family protein [Erysipelotrichaceae bacterium]|nr:GtrA family protein [Erysipelotrichaceae bacterium]
MKDFINSKLFKQIMKFGFVGGTAFLIDYLVMIFLTEVFSINYLISSVISFCISVIYNYIMSIVWVFEVDEEKSKTQTFAMFIILSIIGLLINTVVMWLLVDGTDLMPYTIAKIIATAVVMVYNFISRKIFLEKKE